MGVKVPYAGTDLAWMLAGPVGWAKIGIDAIRGPDKDMPSAPKKPKLEKGLKQGKMAKQTQTKYKPKSSDKSESLGSSRDMQRALGYSLKRGEK